MSFVLLGAAQMPFNDATGGTITTYTLSGKTYRVHSFLSGSTNFVVLRSPQPFDVLCVGGGGGGGGQDGNFHGDGGGGGYDTGTTLVLTPTTYSAVVGGGGGGGWGTWGYGSPGGSSSLSTVSANGGPGGNPAGINGGNYSYGPSNGGTWDWRTGSNVTYGSGGAPNDWDNTQGSGGANTGNGGGGGHTNKGEPAGTEHGGATGGSGIVVVRYQIG
jgi:hypothetical protein